MKRLLDPPVFIGAILIALILVHRIVTFDESPRPEPTAAETHKAICAGISLPTQGRREYCREQEIRAEGDSQ